MKPYGAIKTETEFAARKYLKCSRCGKPLLFGEKGYEKKGRCGKYCYGCIAKVLLEDYGATVIIDDSVALDCGLEVFTYDN